MIWVGQDGTLNDTDGDGAAAPGSDEQQQAGPAEQPAPEQPEQSPQAPPQQPPQQQDDQQQQQMQPPMPPPKRRKKHHHKKYGKGKKSGGGSGAQFIPAKPIFSTTGEFVGWMDPFTDWDGFQFEEGPGQYGVYTITEPIYPASEPASVYPDEDVEPYEEREASSQEEAYEAASTPLVDLSEEQIANLPYPEEFFTGYAMPFTDWDGNVLTEAHPFHLDQPWPETYGPPVRTGWGEPLTDLGGHLLRGPGQYGVFTVSNPYDHRRWDDVDLHRLDPEANTMYHFLVGDDGGPDFGSMLGSLGSALGGSGGGGGAGGGGGGGMGELGSSISNLFSSDGGGSDLGSALGSVASAAAKVAVPVLAKAGTQALSQELSKQQHGAPSAPPPGHPAAHRALTPHARLLQQIDHLAAKYGIARPQTHAAHPASSGNAAAQLQAVMSSLASQAQGGGTAASGWDWDW